MTLQELKSKFTSRLTNLYPIEEILSFFFILTNHKLKLSRVQIALKPQYTLNKKELEFFNTALSDLQQEIPIQYIIGETEFYGLPFKVNKHVLIPRPETEELVDWVLESSTLSFQPSVKILDIGTGSGCIAISLAKKLPNAIVYALDISKEALEVAEQNANLNNVRVNFIEHDILNTTVIETPNTRRKKNYNLKFDLIISNPPYVLNSEKEYIKNNVLNNEPHLALFVKDQNPLLFYDKIAEFAEDNLTKNGQLYFEINQNLAIETSMLLQQKGFRNIKTRKDITGNDRMVNAYFNK